MKKIFDRRYQNNEKLIYSFILKNQGRTISTCRKPLPITFSILKILISSNNLAGEQKETIEEKKISIYQH